MRHFLVPMLERPEVAHVLRVERTGRILASDLEPAFDARSRRKGLLGRSGLAPSAAMILAPCTSIHTFFMRFPIDVVFARRNGEVLKVCPAMKPWRATIALRAFAAIELRSGTVDAGLRRGDRLTVVVP